MNLSNIISGLVIFSAIYCFQCEGKLPESIKTCSRNDPDISKCIIDSIKRIQPQLASGVLAPDFKVTPLEPLHLDNIHIDRGPNFQVHISDLIVTRGASKFQIEKMRVDLKQLNFDFILSFPTIEYNGKYKLNVILGVIPAKSQGDISGTADNFKARVRLQGKRYNGSDGKVYIHFEKLQIKIMTGQSKLELKNLFDENPALKLVATAIVTENSENFVGDLIPPLEKSLNEIALKAANDIVKNASFDEIFPNV